MRKGGIQYQSAIDLICNQPKTFIDTYAENASMKLLPPGADIVTLVQGLGGRIHYAGVFDTDAELNTIFVHGPKDFDIVLPDYSTPRRDRFTIAHELGHYLLHSWQGQRPLKASRNGSDRAEWEANWFAAGFLMPAKQFRRAYDERSSLSWLADRFDVSEHAAKIRCEVLALKI